MESCFLAGRLGELEVFPVERLPRVCTVEEPDSYIADHLGFKVPDIHAHPGVLSGVQRFPVRCASAGAAAYRAQGLVTPES